jgi:hypothetical protein
MAGLTFCCLGGTEYQLVRSNTNDIALKWLVCCMDIVVVLLEVTISLKGRFDYPRVLSGSARIIRVNASYCVPLRRAVFT